MAIVPAQALREIRPVSPFHERGIAHGSSYGLGPAGYDVRVAERVRLRPWRRFVLASTIERFEMPDDLLGIVHDKSTWARRGIACQNTVIEPGWRGYLTLEITYHQAGWLTIAAGTPIVQIVFHRLEAATDAPYRGKYQDQRAGPQPALNEAITGFRAESSIGV